MKKSIIAFIATLFVFTMSAVAATPNFENKLDANQSPAPSITASSEGITISSTQISGGFVDTSEPFDVKDGFNIKLKLKDVPAYFAQEPNGGVITSDIWYGLSFGSKSGWWRAGNDLFAILVRPMSADTTAIEAQYQDSDGFQWIARQEYKIAPTTELTIEMKKDSGVWSLYLNSKKADGIDVSKFDSRFLNKCTNNKAYFGYGYFYAQNTGKTVSTIIEKVNDKSYKGTETAATSSATSSEAPKTSSQTTSSAPSNTAALVVSGITLDENDITLKVGENRKLSTKLFPSGANSSLSWESKDPNIADVDQDGNVTVKKAGSTVITVTTENGKTAQCNIKVEAGKTSAIPFIIIGVVIIVAAGGGAFFFIYKKKKSV